MDTVEGNLYEEDFLSSFFDPIKDDFSITQTASLKSASNPAAVDFDSSPFNFSLSEEEELLCCSSREGGNPEEDEGFEGMLHLYTIVSQLIHVCVICF